MSWTDDRVEALKTMWGEGRSASQIAKALGGVTRNAVIGKVHRLGLSNRAAAGKPAPEAAASAAAKPAAKPGARPAAKSAEPAPPRPAGAAPAPQAAAAPQAAPEAPPAPRPKDPPRRVPVTTARPPQPVAEVSEEARRNLAEVEKNARRLDLLQLTERTCKWPIGDPATDDFYFCGLPAHAGKPYCEAHVSVAFQPMSARRDRARSR